MAHHAFRHAAEEQARHRAVALRAHDHQAGMLLVGILQNDPGRVSDGDDADKLAGRQAFLCAKILQPPVRVGFPGLDRKSVV